MLLAKAAFLIAGKYHANLGRERQGDSIPSTFKASEITGSQDRISDKH